LGSVCEQLGFLFEEGRDSGKRFVDKIMFIPSSMANGIYVAKTIGDDECPAYVGSSQPTESRENRIKFGGED